MSGFIDAEEALILNHYLGGTALVAPDATHWVGLYTTNPADTGSGGVEATGGSYARVSVTNNVTNWPAASGTSPTAKSNGTAVTFPQATAAWGTVTGFGIFDASTSGNLIIWGPLNASISVVINDIVNFAATTLIVRLGDPGDSYA